MMNEEEDIAMILMCHKRKGAKHGGFVYNNEKIQRMILDGHNKN